MSIAFGAYCIGQAAVIFGVRGCPGYGGLGNLYFWVFGLFGTVATVIAVYYIIHPAVWMLTIDKQLSFSRTDVDLPFLSTQPIYVFLDVLLILPGIALLQAGWSETMCQFNFECAFGWGFLLFSLFYPLLRVFCWYVLKRQMSARPVPIPWPTLIIFWVVAIPIVAYVTVSYLNSNVYPRLRVPVVNENTFKGGLEKNPEFADGIVRVQGKLVREIAKCGLFGKDPEVTPYPAGTVLLDMGKKNGQILVKANKPSLVDLLEVEAEGRLDKLFEAFGRLSKLPNPEKRLVCGISKADDEQKGGLALLEIELPKK